MIAREKFSVEEASSRAREPDVAAAVGAVDRYLQVCAGAAAFRKARGAVSQAGDKARFGGLVELGLPSAFVPESAGGSALPEGATVLFGESMGWWLAREPFVENVVLPVALAHRVGDSAVAAAISEGRMTCVAWQEGPFELPSRMNIATTVQSQGDAFRLTGAKRFVMGAAASECMLVLASSNGGPMLVAVGSSAPGVVREDKLLADGSHWSDVEFDLSLPRSALRAQGAHVLEALAAAVSLANLALSGVLHGLQSRILSMTLEYLGTRVQFDRPIGSFQALQHRAADLYAHSQVTRFLLAEAVDALAPGLRHRELEIYASRAKARAADAGQRIAKEGIQMHGAIGFSDEYDLGLYVKRILVLSAWLGGPDWHRRHLADLDSTDVELLA